MKQSWGVFLTAAWLLCWTQIQAQEFNYNRILVQGQLPESGASETDFEFLVIGVEGDTLWRESHNAVELSVEGAFVLEFGAGTFIQGTTINFYDVNWLNAEHVEMYHIGGGRYLQGSFFVQSVPYALHSLQVSQPMSTTNLVDVGSDPYETDAVLKFDGINYNSFIEELSDTLHFAWFTDTVTFADTVWFAFNNDFADTAWFAYFTDSSWFAFNAGLANWADTASFVDSSNYVLSTVGNWSISGNTVVYDTLFVGPTVAESFILKTNNSPRFVFDNADATHANFPGPGFRFNGSKGLLFTPNTNAGLSEIPGSYLYLDGFSRSFHGGTSDNPIDTLKGNYSFAWGENVGTNGTYSAVFGKDTYGDTSIYGGGTPYEAISSFAAGRNCHVTHMGVAIGDSAIASYYRNIAIGKNVISGTASAGVAIGNNILVAGATSWAVGHNLTASGHFSTILGANASSDSKRGGFVFGDLSTTDTVVSIANDQFVARAAGGVIFYSSADLTMGVELLPGAGSWSMVSDRNKKRNIRVLNGLDYAETFNKLPVLSWNYIGNSTAHIGPMAQDIYGLFGVGEKPYYINMIDSDGITFLGIKMLAGELESVPTTEAIEGTNQEILNEKAKLDALEIRVNELYEELDHN